MRVNYRHWVFLAGTTVLALGCSSADEATEPVMETETDPPMMGGEPDEPMTPPVGGPLDCELSTDWAGDEFCIEPPPTAEGFQIHYGPTDYDDPDEVAPFVLEAGGETNLFEPMTAGNEEDIYFYRRQYRMRPGSHHLIISERGGDSGGGLAGMGRRLGGSQNTMKDNPMGELPPENEGIGMPLAAHAPLSVNLHHFNGTTGPILREAWINFWYVDAESVTREAEEMFLWTQGPPVEPNATVVADGRFEILEEGRVLTMYGHRHSNTVRFSAYRTRGEDRQLVYEDYDWEEPAVFEFNSLTKNAAPSPESLVAGAHSGVLELLQGDLLEWECEIVNERSVTITFGENEAETSEMCILVGDAIGPSLLGFSLSSALATP